MTPISSTAKQQALANLKTSVPTIFNEAQKENVVLMQQAVALRKIQEMCGLVQVPVPGQPQLFDDEGEAAFNQEFLRNVNKILTLRRREPHADNIVRFIATFLNYMQKRDEPLMPSDTRENATMTENGTQETGGASENAQNVDNDGPNDDNDNDHGDDSDIDDASHVDSQPGGGESEAMDEDEVVETLSTRFVRMLLMHILKGHNAKSNSVRLRCCQIVALSMSCLNELDEDLYQKLKKVLFERIRDKEASVRIQAANALSKLEISDEEPDASDGLTISQKLINLMRMDSSPEVRRVVILNLEITPNTLPHILERARDTDMTNRRLVFSRVLNNNLRDFRMIPTQDRYRLIQWGLNDRDKSVRIAAGAMISTAWVGQANGNVLEFLERMDVMDMVNIETNEKMLLTVLETSVLKDFTAKFQPEFWNDLTPESVFLARFYFKMLTQREMWDDLETVLPELTRHAFLIKHYNEKWMQANEESEPTCEFIVGQLFEIAKFLDYADEVGRRQMYNLMRDMAKGPDLPEEFLEHIVDVYKLVAPKNDEPEFTRMILDVISDIQEVIEGYEEELDARGKRIRLDGDVVIKTEDDQEEPDPIHLNILYSRLKCLSLSKFMLQRCEKSLANNSTLYGILNQLIIPAVQSKKPILREEGLHCLGLICHLDRTVGLHNIPLFVHCVRSGHDELKNKALMTLFDLISKYGFQAIVDKAPEVVQLFEYCLDHDNPKLQATATEGLAKIMLSRKFNDDEMLKLLTVLYFFPTTSDNSSVKQCLSYFFPAYCHSHSENQRSMARCALVAVQELIETYLDLQENETMTPPNRLVEMIVFWTDPRCQQNQEEKDQNKGLHGPMAVQVLQVLRTCNKNDDVLRKTMVHMLTKLHLVDSDVDDLQKIMTNHNLIENERPIREGLLRNQYMRVIKQVSTALDEKGQPTRSPSMEEEQE
ncbi:nuclear condensing complex subunit [Gongronella butleri]|nr:nuclear condensing complex subunit [Gongronella butleri]